MEIRGFEPLTLGLQSRCSSQLSYIPWLYINKGKERMAVKFVFWLYTNQFTFLLERR